MQHSFDPASSTYRAFLSYSRADKAFVDALFAKFQKYRTPSVLRRSTGNFGGPPRSVNVFLDRRSAQAGGSLDDRIVGAIRSSAFLIVICSAASRKSYWVGREIETFLEHATLDRLLPVFLRDDLSQPLEDILPPPLAALGDRLPIGADIIADDGLEPVSHKLIGALIGFSQDRISREQEKADRARRRTEQLALSMLTVLSLGAAASGWMAYSEARKAESSLQAAMGALGKTTPFVRDLLSVGRLTTDEASAYASSVQTVFESFEKSQIRNDQLQYAWGQVMIKAAELFGEAGSQAQRQAVAERALELLLPSRYDEGPEAQHFICGAAAEASKALAQNGFADQGIARLRTCDEVALAALSFRQPPDRAFARLAADAAFAKIAEAELLMQKDMFSEALDTLNSAAGIDRLGAVSMFDPDSRPSADQELRGQVLLGQGQVYEAMGRYTESDKAYRSALVLFHEAGSDASFTFPVQFALIRVLGIHGGDYPAALDMIEVMDRVLQGALLEDPTRRGVVFIRAQLMTYKGQVLGSIPLSGIPENEAIQSASEAEAAFDLSGELMRGLIEHDPKNVWWRSWEAQRLSFRSDLYFREFERSQDPEASPGILCAEHCLDAAVRDADEGLKQVTSLETGSRAMDAQKIELLIQRARYARYGEHLEKALADIEEADQIQSRLDRTSDGELTSAAVRMRIMDERADIAAALGDSESAIRLYRETLDFYDEAVRREPLWINARRGRLWAARRLAEVSILNGGDSAAEAATEACLRAQEPFDHMNALYLRDRDAILAMAEAQNLPCTN